jgi:hypothetical protein
MNRLSLWGNPLSWHCILLIERKNKVGVNDTPHANSEGKFKHGKKYQNAGHNHRRGVKLQQKQSGN